jgi:hypothetical protein
MGGGAGARTCESVLRVGVASQRLPVSGYQSADTSQRILGDMPAGMLWTSLGGWGMKGMYSQT